MKKLSSILMILLGSMTIAFAQTQTGNNKDYYRPLAKPNPASELKAVQSDKSPYSPFEKSKTFKGKKARKPKFANDSIFYGSLLSDTLTEEFSGLVGLDLRTGEVARLFPYPDRMTAVSGCVVDGFMYMYMCQGNIAGMYVPRAFARMDIATGEFSYIADWQDLENIFMDMTYDPTEDRIYAIAVNSLWIVDRETGDCTKLGDFEPINNRTDRTFYTIACNRYGEMYAIDNETETLCRIDKQSLEVEEIADLWMGLSFRQSMSFDHETDSLYLAAQTSDGHYIATINLETASIHRICDMQHKARVSCLYVPVTTKADEVPVAPADFAIEPSGAFQATLTLSAPAQTLGGSNLGSLDEIRLYRQDSLIHTFADPEPGQVYSYTDQVENSGTYRYYAVAENEQGTSPVAVGHRFVGRDIPGSLQNLKVQETAAENVELSWNLPEYGMENGWIDHSSLHYVILREYGAEPYVDTLEKEWNASTYADADFDTADLRYTYTVIPVTSDGAGPECRSQGVYIGSVSSLPYKNYFDTDESMDRMNMVDANADGITWDLFLTAYVNKARYDGSDFDTADDWLITPPVQVEAGHHYRLSFWYGGSGVRTENIDIWMGNGYHPENMTKKMGSFECTGSQENPVELTFVADETSPCCFGFHAVSMPDQGYLSVGDIAVEEMEENDLQAMSVAGRSMPTALNRYVYEATIRNNGFGTQEGFSVSLIDSASQEVLCHVDADNVLASGEVCTIPLEFAPQQEGIQKIAAMIHKDGDQNTGNDQSPYLAIDVQEAGESEYGQLSSGTSNGGAPLFFAYKSVFNECVYTPEEIELSYGKITDLYLQYEYRGSDTLKIIDNKLNVYMGVSDMDLFTDSYILKRGLAKVLDTTLTLVIPPARNPYPSGEIHLHLDSAFSYTSGNLIVAFERPLDTNHESEYSFYVAYKSVQGANANFLSNVEEYVDDQSLVTLNSYKANIRVKAQTKNLATIAGVVKDLEGNPVEAVTVRIPQLGLAMETGLDGAYMFQALDAGQYELVASAYGYADTSASIEAAVSDTASLDLRLREFANYRLSGVVQDGDGQPMADILVTLTGDGVYAYPDIRTNADGSFVYDKIYAGHECSLMVQKAGYTPYSTVLETSITEDQNLEIILSTIANAPRSIVITESNQESNTLAYTPPIAKSAFRIDGGEPYTILGAENGTEATIMGTAYRCPAYVESVSWYVEEYQSTHGVVHLFVVPLDENGHPMQRLLYYELDVPNKDNRWNHHTFPEPVYAPDGFMVGVSGAGFLGLAAAYPTQEYPFLPNTSYFTRDIFTQPFAALGDTNYYDLADLHCNFMVRATGIALNPDDPNIDTSAEPQAVKGYNLYRFPESQMEDVDSWTLLNESPVSELSYKDASFADAQEGRYRYAVKAVYPGEDLSAAIFSTVVEKDEQDTTSVEYGIDNEFRVYPNPADERLYVEGDVEEVEIFGLNGNLLIESRRKSIDISSLSSGIYLVKVTGEGDKVRLFKIIKY